ncbi:MAG: DNA mismatch repair endonuclease MutL [Armatimonadetes bacterium]|nr:DNA mismatch repair endonuclease MutL [Armatimonadota bacterium]
MSAVTTRVRLLDPHTINQIAAGEVVERPASVVKELVENALDAGSTRITVELKDSGTTLIRISDNGCGMSAEDAATALQRHATSKIERVEDLERVGTLGFRGEALPSIASVSRFSLATAETDGLRTVIRAVGGKMEPVERASGPKGTEIVVEDLFFNTPARLKFLKSSSTELGLCIETLSRYAITFPNVAFKLIHGGHVVLDTPGAGDLFSTLAEVWGIDLARSLAEISTQIGGIGLHGFVSPPHVTKYSRAYQFISVNGRPVKTRTLIAALDQAYRDLTPERRYPVVALNLTIDPTRIDVNVSPTKNEVKFQQEGQAFEALRVGIKSALMEHGLAPNASQIAIANEALAEVRRNTVDESFLAQAPLQFSAPVFQSPSEPLQTFEVTASERFPFSKLIEGLRVIGQAMNTFILAETDHGIAIIDQHVAHERVIYEYLCGLKGPTAIERQPLLTPQTLHLDRRSSVLFKERVDEVRALGFDLEPFGGESYLIRSVPAALRAKDPVKMLRELIDELVESSVSRKLVPTREQIWIMSSCKMAVKAGDPLSHAEMEKLIIDLASTENPYLCPHGRPITISLTKDDLFRKFKRL